MRKLITRTIFLALVVIFINVSIVFLIPENENSYIAANIDKHEALAQITTPKIIFVAGSGAGFGIDSAQIDAAIDDYAVYNMGLHGGLGLRFTLEQVKPYINDGDLVVAMTEYPFFFRETVMDGEQPLRDLIWLDSSNLQYFTDFNQYKGLAVFNSLSAISFARAWLTNYVDPLYYRAAMNEHGDVVSHLGNQYAGEKRRRPVAPTEPTEVSAEVITLLNELAAYTTDQNADIIFIHSATAAEYVEDDAANFSILTNYIEENLTFDVIGSPEQHIFPLDHFHDNNYHLSDQGRSLRAEVLIDLLTDYLATP